MPDDMLTSGESPSNRLDQRGLWGGESASAASLNMESRVQECLLNVAHFQFVAHVVFSVLVNQEEKTLTRESSERHRDHSFVKAFDSFVFVGSFDYFCDSVVLLLREVCLHELVLLESGPHCSQRVQK